MQTVQSQWFLNFSSNLQAQANRLNMTLYVRVQTLLYMYKIIHIFILVGMWIHMSMTLWSTRPWFGLVLKEA